MRGSSAGSGGRRSGGLATAEVDDKSGGGATGDGAIGWGGWATRLKEV